MTADTMTASRLYDIAAALKIAADSAHLLALVADAGDVTPAEAADEVAEIIANINALAK